MTELGILQFHELAPGKLREQFDRVVEHLRAGRFAAAEVRKMPNTGFYRAKLNDADRLLFRFGRHEQKTHLLLYEIILNHNYSGSRFLRGKIAAEADFNQTLPDGETVTDATPVACVPSGTRHFRFLDRVLCFDPEQHQAFHLPTPLILIGSAGSGKTVLALERMKGLPGRVLYVTHSAYLVENARRLYYTAHTESEDKQIDFLSFRELLDSIRVTKGRELNYREFSAWFARMRAGYHIRDGRKLYEEIKGVITGGSPDRHGMTRDEYLALGVRQSILPEDEREEAWRLHEKLTAHLRDAGLHDLSVVAATLKPLAKPEYDWLVVDEIQDFTIPQIALLLALLKDNCSFIFSGDSNQIVHPNFFSWSRIKTLFYARRAAMPAEIVRVLYNNYRNAGEVTRLANRLLCLKQQRFGSIDRESNYLVKSRARADGTVALFADSDRVRQEINKKTGRSAGCAVVTIDDESRTRAEKIFDTPLVFTVHEAKGLEYDTVILYDMVSAAEREFRTVAEGITPETLEDELVYNRAHDKSDKSGEVYKFYINALYVAMTRAMTALYFVERAPCQPLFTLLGLEPVVDAELKASSSTADEWRREAAKLELQGRDEQARRIRSQILKIQPVPWPVYKEADFARDSAAKTLAAGGRDLHKTVFDYAVAHDYLQVIPALVAAGYKQAKRVEEGRSIIRDRHCQDCLGRGAPRLREAVRKYGVDYLTAIGDTPMTAAVRAGSAEALVILTELGANCHRANATGMTPLLLASLCLQSRDYANRLLARLLPLVLVPSFSVRTGGQLRKIDVAQGEFMVLLFILANLRQSVAETAAGSRTIAFAADELAAFTGIFPDEVAPAHRKARQYVSSLLAKNEITKPSPWNRGLLFRVERGWYVPNPLLEVEIGGEWRNIADLAGVELILQTGSPHFTKSMRQWLDKVRAAVERFYIRFGSGEIFNPAEVAKGARVVFDYGRREYTGVVVKRERAAVVVETDDGRQWGTSMSLIRRIVRESAPTDGVIRAGNISDRAGESAPAITAEA